MLHTDLSTGFVDCLRKAAYALALRHTYTLRSVFYQAYIAFYRFFY